MKTFIIDDEEALCRHLAAKAWTDHHVSVSDKELQEKMRKENEKERFNQFVETMGTINKTKSKPGAINWEYLKNHNPKKYAKLMREENKKKAGVA